MDIPGRLAGTLAWDQATAIPALRALLSFFPLLRRRATLIFPATDYERGMVKKT
jgi:hypothetical protein